MTLLREEGATHILCAYGSDYFRQTVEAGLAMGMGVMLDSGAYSAFTQGLSVTVEEYAAVLRDYAPHVDAYVNLDVCDDPAQTAKNQDQLEERRFSPLPVYHFGEPIEWLDRLSSYEYIGLGNSSLSSQRPQDLFESWVERTTTDNPTKWFHGFAVGTLKPRLMGLHSVDSTTWTVAARYGRLLGRKGEVRGHDKGLFFTRDEMLRHNIRALLWQATNTRRQVKHTLPLGFAVEGQYA